MNSLLLILLILFGVFGGLALLTIVLDGLQYLSSRFWKRDK